MPERTNGTVLKTVGARVPVGSNPTPSASRRTRGSGRGSSTVVDPPGAQVSYAGSVPQRAGRSVTPVKRWSTIVLALVVVAVAGASAACGGGSDLSGTVTVRGSTTLLPVVSEVADGFARRNPLVDFDVDMVGSQEGINDFCAGLVPIAGSSRPLTPSERANCRTSGVHFASFEVAHDAVVLLSRTDPPLTCITLPQLYAAAGPDARGVDTWEQIAAASGTSPSDLPSGPFELVGPGPKSGTLAVFQADALGPEAAQRGASARIRDDYTVVDAEQAIRNALSTRPGAIGFVGYATAVDWSGSIRPVAVDDGGGCVRPTPASLRDGSYPLTRDLFLLVNLDDARTQPQIRGFVTAFLGAEGQAAPGRVGSVSLSTAETERESARWADLAKGGGS